MTRFLLLTFMVFADFTVGQSEELPEILSRTATSHSQDAIDVKLSGQLSVGVSTEGPSIGGRMEFQTANIESAGTTIHLDVSRSEKIRDELVWWSKPRTGDIRWPCAVVTGKMVFKPLKDVENAFQVVRPGITADTPVPVVVVESIQVFLAYPGSSRPTGPQHNRKLIVADDQAKK